MNNLEAEYNNIIQAMVDIWRHKSSSYVLNLSSTDLHPPGLQSTYLLSVGELILCFTPTHTHSLVQHYFFRQQCIGLLPLFNAHIDINVLVCYT